MSRRLHSATVMGIDLVIFGGISMEDNSDLNDLCYLTKVILACMCVLVLVSGCQAQPI